MIGIAQADLRADVIAEFMLMHRFNGGRGTHGHENGRVDRTVIGFDLAGTGAGVGVCVEEGKIQERGLLFIEQR